MTVPRHLAHTDGVAGSGLTRGPTAFAVRRLRRTVMRGTIGDFAADVVYAIGDGSPVERELFRVTLGIGTVLWVFAGLIATAIPIALQAVLGSTWTAAWSSPPAWAAAYGAVGCTSGRQGFSVT
jgi:hypothetical protein